MPVGDVKLSAESARELDKLATDTLTRLEAMEPLHPLLLAARRVAEEVGDSDAAEWLSVERAGLEGTRRDPSRGEAQLRGISRFMRLHATEDLDKIDLDDLTRKFEREQLPRRRMIAYQSVAQT